MSSEASSPAGSAASPPPLEPPARVRKRMTRRSIILLSLLGVGLAGGGTWWFLHRGLENTDDAQIDGDVVPVPARVSAPVVELHFTENQVVHAGDLLVVLDDQEARARLEQAEATLASAEATAQAAEADAEVARTNAIGNRSIAQASLRSASAGAASARDQISQADAALRSTEATLRQADQDRERNRKLLEQGAIPRVVLDQYETAYNVALSARDAAKARLSQLHQSASQATGAIAEASARAEVTGNVDVIVQQATAKAKSARAQVASATASRDLAKLQLSYTRIVAPQDGVISKRTVTVGQMVAAGQPVAQLIAPGLWVTANFKETQIADMHVGQPASFSVDAFPGHDFHGQVESFSGATGSRFSLLPPDNASGNFTKVVQRLPVRVHIAALPKGVALRPGMSVDLTVDTRH
jgi:membrane fusion protein (multidrug efflux system)